LGREGGPDCHAESLHVATVVSSQLYKAGETNLSIFNFSFNIAGAGAFVSYWGRNISFFLPICSIRLLLNSEAFNSKQRQICGRQQFEVVDGMSTRPAS